ncbi:2-succinyl-5-enolpyruvyl-6-hydroxy-3-cyclohexene-1-carboxylic-acid synthase [Salinicoccus albus]|uniref:2-succinyl-5-enolpyruvyl-6-hydroxy-3- cyclohexene-1-carboxylic-acid synthase n=1 Tax=Salinicoccus albus TaxID=418756 RepID=UPI000382213B|nr:2-succinyl-5-enolpyruvyl-6-hydroxy-3-cyclohexene-1-carboxylic-acid synthase [Salinicoccus albus]
MNHQELLTKQVFTLVDILWSHGVDEVVISPGSRSTPIAIAAELHPHIKTYVHPDERSAAFFALGLSKRDHSPVGIICTSGTAAANYTPAIAEAELSHLPLIAITADRPHELRDVGAPQSIDQNNMYGNYVKYYTELPPADAHKSALNLIGTKVMQCSRYFNGNETGPVQINVPVREPLIPDITRTDLFYREKAVRPEYQLTDHALTELTGTGLVLIGETMETLSGIEPVLDKDYLAVIADPRQHIRKTLHNTVTHHDLIFNALDEDQFSYIEENVDYILRIGDPLTSKAVNSFLSATEIPQYLISEHQNLKTFPIAPYQAFVGQVRGTLKNIEFKPGGRRFKHWFSNMDAAVESHIDLNIHQYTDEGRCTYEIFKHTEAGRSFFLSSSMPVRDGERYDTVNTHTIYANRGANGIDGVVSTALGMASKQKVTLIIGDVALYHDMNGLIMSKLEDVDLNIIVFNNNGGGIFSFLPQYDNQDHFERLFGTPLDLDFRHTAALYDFNYHEVNSYADIDSRLVNAAGRNLIEIKTDREQNLKQHQQMKTEIGDMVKSIGY